MNPAALVFYLYLGVMGWMFQRRTQWLSRFGICTTLLGALFVRYGVAVPFSDGVNPSVTQISITPERLADYYVAVLLVYACIYLGIWLVDLTWRDRRLRRTGSVAPTLALAVVAVLITGVVILAWIVIPWDDFVDGVYSLLPGHSAETYRQHRVQYGTETAYSGSALAYVGSFARFALAPVALWILFFHRHRSKVLLIMFWFLLATLVVIGVLSGQKLPGLLLAAGFIVALLVERGRPSILSWRALAAGIAFVGAIVPALYYLQYPQLGYSTVLELTVYRLTEEYSRVAQLRFVFYPDLHPHLYGASSFIVRNALLLLGIGTTAESPEIYIPSHSPGAGPAYGGVWNAGFFADAWADFGFTGVIAASLVIGVVVRAIDRWYSASGRGALEMGAYTAACISAIYVSEVATLTVLWTYGLASAFLVYALLRFADGPGPLLLRLKSMVPKRAV